MFFSLCWRGWRRYYSHTHTHTLTINEKWRANDVDDVESCFQASVACLSFIIITHTTIITIVYCRQKKFRFSDFLIAEDTEIKNTRLMKKSWWSSKRGDRRRVHPQTQTSKRSKKSNVKKHTSAFMKRLRSTDGFGEGLLPVIFLSRDTQQHHTHKHTRTDVPRSVIHNDSSIWWSKVSKDSHVRDTEKWRRNLRVQGTSESVDEDLRESRVAFPKSRWSERYSHTKSCSNSHLTGKG